MLRPMFALLAISLLALAACGSSGGLTPMTVTPAQGNYNSGVGGA